MDEAPAGEREDPLATRVRELLDGGALELSQITARATDDLPPEQRFGSAGKIAELLARLAWPELSRTRPWVLVREGLSIEDWRVRPARTQP